MDSIDSGKQKMRAYFANQRERQQRPIKANIPLPQDNVAQTVSRPIIVREAPYYQPQVDYRPAQPPQPREKVRFNYPAFGFSMLIVSGIVAYLYFTKPSIQAQLYPLIHVVPEMAFVVIAFLLSCFMMLFIGKR